MRNIGAIWGFVGCLVTFGCGGETGEKQTCADCTGGPPTTGTQTGGAAGVATTGSHTGGSQTVQGAGGSPNVTVTAQSGLSTCSWPSALNGPSRDQCHASRRMLNCTTAGGGELCTTDGGATCQGSGALMCKDKCAADEYVAECGGVGPGNVPEPPAGCTSAGAVPAGIAFYCCPCGS